MNCQKKCQSNNEECVNNQCRYWINFKPDLNCSMIAIEKNGPMRLESIAKRFNMTVQNLEMIEKKALNKFKKRTMRISTKIDREFINIGFDD